jgi:hypothetical protein
MGHLYNLQRLKEIELFYSFDPCARRDNKQINFAGNSFRHENGHIDCKGLTREDFLLWLKEASQQMLDFRKNEHDKLII